MKKEIIAEMIIFLMLLGLLLSIICVVDNCIDIRTNAVIKQYELSRENRC